MNPALEVVNRSLHGDPGARAFLERTAAIYVLDMTDSTQPKTYGCWNFIHTAISEVERFENQHARDLFQGASLVSHVRLLATMALKVARRSPARDKALVITSITNAWHASGSVQQSQWLIDLNVELREIVMGRIAAMSFDSAGTHGQSAFADPVVRDTFCAILSANAVSSGPNAIRHFATEWIIPSAQNLPKFALASVVLHLAQEGRRVTAPAGSKAALQQLSLAVISEILVPIFFDTIVEREGMSLSSPESSRSATACLRTLIAWCDATDLSLPQVKHICSKVNVDIIAILSDATYSDSHVVIDALADLVESIVRTPDEFTTSDGCMEQVRYIIQVDEDTFRARFSAAQLNAIESREMTAILDHLTSAVSLQRYRFAERQSKGDDDFCRNLARLAVSVCNTRFDILRGQESRNFDHGIFELLIKAASHPSLHVCGLVLPALSRMVLMSVVSLEDVLPILQRRAITPFSYRPANSDSTELAEVAVSHSEFHHFRGSVLAETLNACFSRDGDAYMASCTSAIEEFCADRRSTDFSYHLEAALFCIEALNENVVDSNRSLEFSKVLSRVLVALSRKHQCLLSNPVTVSQMCHFLAKFSSRLDNEGDVGTAAGLALSAFDQSENSLAVRTQHINSDISIISDAGEALESILRQYPNEFTERNAFASLKEVWQAAIERSAENISLPIAYSRGLCYVCACASTREAGVELFLSIVTPSLNTIDRLSRSLGDKHDQGRRRILCQLSEEIKTVGLMVKAFSQAPTSSCAVMESGCDSSSNDYAEVPDGVIHAISNLWHILSHLAANHGDDENVCTFGLDFLSDLLPRELTLKDSPKRLHEIRRIAASLIDRAGGGRSGEAVCSFLTRVAKDYGRLIDGDMAAASEPKAILRDLIMRAIHALHRDLGGSWSSPDAQGRGQAASEIPFVVPKNKLVSTESLASVLSLLTTILKVCPAFVFSLPASSTQHDDLMHQAADSAAVCLNEQDADIIQAATNFLKELASCTESKDDTVRKFSSSAVSSICAQVLTQILRAACGANPHSTLEDLSALLSSFLHVAQRYDIEHILTSVLNDESFLLGQEAKLASLSALLKYADRQADEKEVNTFLEDVWNLHQVDDPEALPMSDAVQRFVRRYM